MDYRSWPFESRRQVIKTIVPMSNLTTTAIERKSAGTSAPPRSPAVVTTLATRMVSPGTADAQRRAELHRELVQQLSPVGAIEQILVAELARRATELEQRSTTVCSLREVATALGQAVLREDGFSLTGNARYWPLRCRRTPWKKPTARAPRTAGRFFGRCARSLSCRIAGRRQRSRPCRI